MEGAHYKLVVGDFEDCKETMEQCEKILEGLTNVEPVINASFYRVSADYYKVLLEVLAHTHTLSLSLVHD